MDVGGLGGVGHFGGMGWGGDKVFWGFMWDSQGL